jgi:hypothetical protein
MPMIDLTYRLGSGYGHFVCVRHLIRHPEAC